MPSPLFSIITASYNSESTIRDNLRSVASQSFSDFEHLIIDNQSQDETISICESVHEKLSSTGISLTASQYLLGYDEKKKKSTLAFYSSNVADSPLMARTSIELNEHNKDLDIIEVIVEGEPSLGVLQNLNAALLEEFLQKADIAKKLMWFKGQ